MRIGVVTFPGTLDDVDAARAVRLAGGTPVPLWHADTSVGDVAAVVLPGGFSYGDYLRAGAIAGRARIMADIKDRAAAGMPVLGICNGFQMLCEAGLLPGALVRNRDQRFICTDQRLRIEAADTPWTSGYEQGTEIVVPLKNMDGCYMASDALLQQVEGDGQVAVRYVGANPNGSRNDIAGVRNSAGNVVGLMPHPEHAIEPGYGPDAVTGTGGTDGLTFFTSVLQGVLA